MSFGGFNFGGGGGNTNNNWNWGNNTTNDGFNFGWGNNTNTNTGSKWNWKDETGGFQYNKGYGSGYTTSGSYTPKSFKTSSNYNYSILVLEDLREVVLGPGTSNGLLSFFDIKTHKLKRSLSVSSNYIWGVVRANKKEIVCGGGDYQQGLAVVDIKKNKVVGRLSGHTSSIYGMINIGKKNLVGSCGQDSKFIIWDVKKRVAHQTIAGTGGLMSACFCSKKRLLFLGGYARTIPIYKFKNKKYKEYVSSGTINVSVSGVWSLKHYNGQFLLVGHNTGVEIYDVDKKTQLARLNIHSNYVYSIFKVPKKPIFITGSYDRSVCILDLKQRKTLKKVYLNGYTYAVTMDKRGRIYASGHSQDVFYFDTPYKYSGGDDGDDDDDDDVLDEWEDEDEGVVKMYVDGYKSRFEWLKEQKSKFFNVKFLFGPNKKEVLLFKSLLIASKNENISNNLSNDSNTNTISIDNDDLPYDHNSITINDIVNVICGIPLKIEDKKLFDLFCLFNMLGMHDRSYLICKLIEEVKKIGLLLFMYKKSYEKFEKVKKKKKKSSSSSANEEDSSELNQYLSLDDDESDKESDESDEEDENINIKGIKMYNSPFTLAIMNEFNERQDEIMEKKKVFRIFQKENLIVTIKDHHIAPIKKHPTYNSMKKFPKSFYSAFHSDVIELYRKKKFFNISLKSSDGKIFKTHKEIMVLKLNFFKSLLMAEKFDEKKEGGINVIELKECSSGICREFISYIYTNDIRTQNLNILFQLLSLSTEYGDHRLYRKVEKRLRKESCKHIEKNDRKVFEFLKEYVINNKYIAGRDEIVNEFIEDWADVGDVERSKVRRFIDKSKTDKRIEKLSKKIVNLEQENEKLAKLYDEMKRQVDEIKASK